MSVELRSTSELALNTQSFNAISSDTTTKQIEQKAKDADHLIQQLEEFEKNFKEVSFSFSKFEGRMIPNDVVKRIIEDVKTSLQESDAHTLAKGDLIRRFTRVLSEKHLDSYFNVYLYVQEGKVHLFVKENLIGAGSGAETLSGFYFKGNELFRDKVLRTLKRREVNEKVIFPAIEHFKRSIEMNELVRQKFPNTKYFIKPDHVFSYRESDSKVYFYGSIEDNAGHCLDDLRVLHNQKRIDLIQEIGAALLELHACKLFHGDLSLRNILYSKGSVKIIDLGETTSEETTATVRTAPTTLHIKYIEAEKAQRKLYYKSMEIFSAAAVTVFVLNESKDPFSRFNFFIADSAKKMENIVKEVLRKYKDQNFNPQFEKLLTKALDPDQNHEIDLKEFDETLRDCVKRTATVGSKEQELKEQKSD